MRDSEGPSSAPPRLGASEFGAASEPQSDGSVPNLSSRGRSGRARWARLETWPRRRTESPATGPGARPVTVSVLRCPARIIAAAGAYGTGMI